MDAVALAMRAQYPATETRIGLAGARATPIAFALVQEDEVKYHHLVNFCSNQQGRG
jgi:hypothetical protein